MARTLLIDVRDRDERRAALLEDGRLSLYQVERDDDCSLVGNVYKGRVLRVEPAIDAAFVDVGLDRPGFLPSDDRSLAGDVPPPSGAVDGVIDGGRADGGAPGDGSGGEAAPESAPGPRPSAPRPPIAERVSVGDEIVVQVARDPVGRKGATLTTQIAYPGRTLVLIPRMGRRAVSRRITDPAERARIQAVIDAIQLPPGCDDCGFVARTAVADASPEEIASEAASLAATKLAVDRAMPDASAPAVLHREAEFVVRAVRELAVRAPEGSEGPLEIVVDPPEEAEQARVALGSAPGVVVRGHEGAAPLFHAAGAERAVRDLEEATVPLPGGASLVIHESEAMWTIDVNSGRMRDGGTLEETALQTDLLAAREAARQIRLRDLSGLVVVDFIDCREPANREKVEAAFRAELAKDPSRLRSAPMSEFMIVEITRRRMRSGPARTGSVRCPCCRGRGRVRTAASAALAALRDLRNLAAGRRGGVLEARCAGPVAESLLGRTEALARLREAADVRVVPVADAAPGWFDVRRVA